MTPASLCLCLRFSNTNTTNNNLNNNNNNNNNNVLLSYDMSFIEHYLYSLPQYRFDKKRSFIEIFSFNGLQASRKVIGEILPSNA